MTQRNTVNYALANMDVIQGPHCPAVTLAWSVRNIHCPQRFTFEVEGRLRISFVLEPGITKNLVPSPALNPLCKEMFNLEDQCKYFFITGNCGLCVCSIYRKMELRYWSVPGNVKNNRVNEKLIYSVVFHVTRHQPLALLISARPQRQTNAKGCRIFGDLDKLKSKDTVQKTVDWSPRRREERK